LALVCFPSLQCLAVLQGPQDTGHPIPPLSYFSPRFLLIYLPTLGSCNCFVAPSAPGAIVKCIKGTAAIMQTPPAFSLATVVCPYHVLPQSSLSALARTVPFVVPLRLFPFPSNNGLVTPQSLRPTFPSPGAGCTGPSFSGVQETAFYRPSGLPAPSTQFPTPLGSSTYSSASFLSCQSPHKLQCPLASCYYGQPVWVFQSDCLSLRHSHRLA